MYLSAMVGKFCYQISKVYVRYRLSYISLKTKNESVYKTPLYKLGHIYYFIIQALPAHAVYLRPIYQSNLTSYISSYISINYEV